jgi:hypothetical protein
LAETKAGTKAEAGAGTRGTETEAAVALAIEIAGTIVRIVAGTQGTETGTMVTLAVETFGIAGIVGTEAGIIRIAGIVGTAGTAGTAGVKTETGVGIALRIKAFSFYAQLNKNSK